MARTVGMSDVYSSQQSWHSRPIRGQRRKVSTTNTYKATSQLAANANLKHPKNSTSPNTIITTVTMSLNVYALHWSQADRIVWLCEEIKLLNPDFTYTLHLFSRSLEASEGRKTLAALHPTATAPTIVDATVTPNVTISESQAILMYILEVHGGAATSALRPAPPPASTPQAYAQYLFWLSFANGSFQPAVNQDIYAASFLATPNFPTESLATNPAHQYISKRVQILLGVYESHLSSPDYPYLAGREFSAADMMNDYGLTIGRLIFPIDLTAYPNTVAWLKRITARKAYRRAMEIVEEGCPALWQPVVRNAPYEVLLQAKRWDTVEELMALKEVQEREDREREAGEGR